MVEQEQGQLTVIVAEDEPRILRHIVSKIEEKLPYCRVVATATNGREALERVRELHPDVVFTDIKMPEMGGLELSRVLHMEFPRTYVVLLSGYSDFSFAQQAIRYGVFSYLLKPLEDDKLQETVGEIRRKMEESGRETLHSVVASRSIRSNEPSFQDFFREKYCAIVNICFFNLCYDNRDELLGSRYIRLLKGLDWEKVFHELWWEPFDWIVSDETSANQKSLIVSVRRPETWNAEEFCRLLRERIEAIYPKLPANLCCHLKAVAHEKTWTLVKRMRKMMEARVVAGFPSLYVLERDEWDETGDRLMPVRLRVQNTVKSLIRAGNREALREEMLALFRFMRAEHFPQKLLQKGVELLFKSLEFSFDRVDAAAL